MPATRKQTPRGAKSVYIYLQYVSHGQRQRLALSRPEPDCQQWQLELESADQREQQQQQQLQQPGESIRSTGGHEASFAQGQVRIEI